jgi:hypothetical protein
VNWTEPDGVAVVILDADAVRHRNDGAGGRAGQTWAAEDIGVLRRIGGVALQPDSPRSAAVDG